MTQLFEQQPRESNKAFAAFRAYLDMGPERSTAAVAKELAKSRQLVRRWSAKFGWTERVQAYAAHVAEVERKAIEAVAVEKAVEWVKTHEPIRREAWQEAEKTIAMLREARKRWEESGRTPGFEGMARMLELAFKLKQFAAGMPSEVKEVNTNIRATIDVEWEIAIRKAYGVAAPPATTALPAGEPAVVDVEEVKAGPQTTDNKTTEGKV